MHPLFDVVKAAVANDIEAMIEDGHDTDKLAQDLEAVAAKGSLDALLDFELGLWNLPAPSDKQWTEPSDWESIAKMFPDPDSHARFHGSEADLADRIHGAWLGRIAGCQLGKPMEMAWPAECKQALQEVGSWPLTDYMNPVASPERLAQLRQIDGYGKRLVGHQRDAKGNFNVATSDDDTTYSLVGMITLEKHGIGFTTDQQAEVLVHKCPRGALHASGLNMFLRRAWGMSAPYTALFGNTSRQSLGAMIRCDPFGWAAPANPALAAKMSYQDAFGSQTKNGIYSGMFFAILIADVFAHGDPMRAARTALAYVPSKSRFAEMVRWTMDLCDKTDDWEKANAEIFRKYDVGYKRSSKVRGNHSIPNAALVIMALHYARGSFDQAIGIATMAGMDTDCTAATAGSIFGAAIGAAHIPAKWSAPLNDTLCTTVMYEARVKISELARRMFQIARPNCKFA